MAEKNEAKDTIFKKKRLINIRGQLLEIDRPWVMGILNVTPDSFFDGGRYSSELSAVVRAGEILEEGATIIDIGASSTRPGAEMLTATEEIKRLQPVLPSIRKEFPEAILSVDTFLAEVARAAADMGADIINDISGGTLDEEMPRAMGQLRLPYILMHIKGTPQNMQDNPHYADVFKDVAAYFARQLEIFHAEGVNDIILDPGFGFAKTVEHNYELLQKLSLFRMFERPLLAGVSRKSMVNKVLEISSKDALNGTTVVNTIALQNGADILRVHDVREAVEAVKIVTFTQNFT